MLRSFQYAHIIFVKLQSVLRNTKIFVTLCGLINYKLNIISNNNKMKQKLVLNKSLFVLLFLLVFFINICHCQLVFTNIPKNVWQYWWQGEQNLSFCFKLTIYRNKRLLEAQGWKHNLLDGQSIQKYIKLPTHINFKKFQQKHEVDWIRLKLLYDYGGVWIDTNILILESLDFLYNLKNNDFVFNKFGQGPQIYGNFMDSYGTRKVDIDNQGNTVRLSPGFEISFIAAVPNASLILEARLQLQNFYTDAQGLIKAIDKTLESQKVEIGNQYRYYLATNMAFQVCLQRKQHQLDAKFIGKDRKYAVKQYRLWCTENSHGNYQLQYYSSFSMDQAIIFMATADINDLQYPLWGQIGPRYFSIVWYASFFSKYYDNFTAPLIKDQFNRMLWTIFIKQVYPQLSQIYNSSFAVRYILNQTFQANKQFGLSVSRLVFKQPLKELQFSTPTYIGWILISINFLLSYLKFLLIIMLCIIIGRNCYRSYLQQLGQASKQKDWNFIQEDQQIKLK